MINHFVSLFLGTPKRLLGTLCGLMVVFAIVDPTGFNWLMVRAFNALWPWIQIGIFGAIAVAIFRSLLPKPAGKSSKKGD